MEQDKNFKETFWIDKTIASFDIVFSDIKRILRISRLLISIIMIAFYTYSVFSSLSTPHLLVINSIMLGLLIISFLVDRIFENIEKKNKKVKKVISRTLTYFKHLVKLVATSFAIYELVSFDLSILQTIATLFTTICVIIQITMDIIILIFERYIRIIKKGMELDKEEFFNSNTVKNVAKAIDTIKHPLSNAIELADKAITKITKKTENKDSASIKPVLKTKNTSKNEKKIIERAEQLRAEKEAKTLDKNVAKEQSSKNRLSSAKDKFKKHWNELFNRNDSNQDKDVG